MRGSTGPVQILKGTQNWFVSYGRSGFAIVDSRATIEMPSWARRGTTISKFELQVQLGAARGIRSHRLAEKRRT
jgi:hypothetical protein